MHYSDDVITFEGTRRRCWAHSITTQPSASCLPNSLAGRTPPSPPPLAPHNLLENTAGGRSFPAVLSRDGSMLPCAPGDARSIDDVMVHRPWQASLRDVYDWCRPHAACRLGWQLQLWRGWRSTPSGRVHNNGVGQSDNSVTPPPSIFLLRICSRPLIDCIAPCRRGEGEGIQQRLLGCGSLLLPASADVRSSDAAIAFAGRLTPRAMDEEQPHHPHVRSAWVVGRNGYKSSPLLPVQQQHHGVLVLQGHQLASVSDNSVTTPFLQRIC